MRIYTCMDMYYILHVKLCVQIIKFYYIEIIKRFHVDILYVLSLTKKKKFSKFL